MALFTAETAATMAHKRWTAEKEAKLKPRILAAPTELNAEQTPTQAELARVREHIESLNQQLDDCTDPDTWDCLTRSKERLFKIWARLAQIPTDPKPVQQRATNTRKELPPPTVAQAQPGPQQGKPEAGQGQAGAGQAG